MMKGIVWTIAVVCACGGDDGAGGTDASIQGGVGEPANLVGITLAHNQVRALVDTSGIAGGPLPPMQWNSALAAHAAAWASMCIDGDGNGLVDHSSSGYRSNVGGFSYVGENIFASGSSMASATQAVQVWAEEKNDFTYPSCAGGAVCGHYTQIVWRSSVNLGCANVTCGSLQYKGVVLCQYGPGGNSGGAPY
jgi:pathogenesis-related protein 1